MQEFLVSTVALLFACQSVQQPEALRSGVKLPHKHLNMGGYIGLKKGVYGANIKSYRCIWGLPKIGGPFLGFL